MHEPEDGERHAGPRLHRRPTRTPTPSARSRSARTGRCSSAAATARTTSTSTRAPCAPRTSTASHGKILRIDPMTGNGPARQPVLPSRRSGEQPVEGVGARACATRSGSPSTRPTASRTSATSAGTTGRRSTPARAPTSAGRATRAAPPTRATTRAATRRASTSSATGRAASTSAACASLYNQGLGAVQGAGVHVQPHRGPGRRHVRRRVLHRHDLPGAVPRRDVHRRLQRPLDPLPHVRRAGSGHEVATSAPTRRPVRSS